MPRNPDKRRCSALNAAGRRCKAWALPPGDPPRCAMHRRCRNRCEALTAAGKPCTVKPLPGHTLCHIHAGHIHPQPQHRRAGRACTAAVTRSSGQRRPCKGWAMPGADPPLCFSHSRNSARALRIRPASRRCQALTAAGNQCANWALRPSPGRPAHLSPLCIVHAGLTPMPRDTADHAASHPVRRRCTARTRQDRRCACWAMRRGDPPRCFIHTHGARSRLPDAADRARGRQCTARNLSGQRCRRWALRHTPRAAAGSPLCWLHAFPHRHGLIRHSYYRRVPHFTPAQHVRLATLARDEERPLAAELHLVRLKLRGVLQYLDDSRLSSPARLAAAGVVFRAVKAAAGLLQARKKLVNVNGSPGFAGGAGYLLARIVQEYENASGPDPPIE